VGPDARGRWDVLGLVTPVHVSPYTHQVLAQQLLSPTSTGCAFGAKTFTDLPYSNMELELTAVVPVLLTYWHLLFAVQHFAAKVVTSMGHCHISGLPVALESPNESLPARGVAQPRFTTVCLHVLCTCRHTKKHKQAYLDWVSNGYYRMHHMVQEGCTDLPCGMDKSHNSGGLLVAEQPSPTWSRVKHMRIGGSRCIAQALA
jgi:hypothetical protein